MKLPTLYKRGSTGKIFEWTISVKGAVISTRWGEVGGALQETHDTISQGKNIGRANETTPEQQAELEAQAQWEKKLKKDYVKTMEAASKGEASDLIDGGILPMLAHKYSEHGEKVKWPAFAQPKLDGHRCIAIVDKAGKCTLWSRTRKPILSMPHIVAAVERYAKPNTIWDGELYNPDYHDRFEELTSLIRPEYAKPGHEVVQYHIYDAVLPVPFKDRVKAFVDMASGHSPLVAVETQDVKDEDDMMLFFERCLESGYEGAIVRNAAGMYVNKRSYDLLKVKEFLDSEYEIIGVQEGRGKLAGHGIFECKTEKGITFSAKMAGDMAALKKFLEHPGKYIGKQLTVKYQGLTKTGVPRFPVALRIRENDGE